eukprot:6202363-Pleurochrysis_carterae.AAC.2
MAVALGSPSRSTLQTTSPTSGLARRDEVEACEAATLDFEVVGEDALAVLERREALRQRSRESLLEASVHRVCLRRRHQLFELRADLVELSRLERQLLAHAPLALHAEPQVERAAQLAQLGAPLGRARLEEAQVVAARHALKRLLVLVEHLSSQEHVDARNGQRRTRALRSTISSFGVLAAGLNQKMSNLVRCANTDLAKRCRRVHLVNAGGSCGAQQRDACGAEDLVLKLQISPYVSHACEAELDLPLLPRLLDRARDAVDEAVQLQPEQLG